MYAGLLTLIYIAFISLGLPDSLIGSAWPLMHNDLNVPTSYAGIITMTISVGTIISSLSTGYLTKKFSTGLITAISVLLTAVALLGFSSSNSFLTICLWAVPYGLGAGAVDAALNNYVAVHYATRHMNWLHAFWGIGASISPYIMGFALTNQNNWHLGYQIIGIFQLILTFILLISVPRWQTNIVSNDDQTAVIDELASLTDSDQIPITDSDQIPIWKTAGVMPALITFFAYATIEQTSGLWASSFFVNSRGASLDIAATLASLFYIGITLGRLISGVISNKLSDQKLIKLGCYLTLFGIIILFIPNKYCAFLSLVLIGFGCAPIFPSLIHATPTNFGRSKSQSIMGFQMAISYLGTTLMPPLFGLISRYVSMSILPIYLLIAVIVMLVMIRRIPFKNEIH